MRLLPSCRALPASLRALRRIGGLRAGGVVLAAALGAAAFGSAADGYRAPRGPGGVNPDLNGIWQALGEAHYDIERHLARASLSLRPGPHGPLPDLATVRLGAVASVPPGPGVVEGGAIPYKPEALAKRNENRRLWIDRDPEIKCFLPGVPRATYMPQPFRILQGEREIEFVYQWAGAVRNIYSADPGPAPVDSWMGQSVASWEGDTLVLTVTGLNGDTWFDRAGNHHSNQMTVVERYTPSGPNHLRYEATIDDPETFTRPWKLSMPLYRRMEPNAMILDFKCVAFVEELMYGAWRRKPLERWPIEAAPGVE